MTPKCDCVITDYVLLLVWSMRFFCVLKIKTIECSAGARFAATNWSKLFAQRPLFPAKWHPKENTRLIKHKISTKKLVYASQTALMNVCRVSWSGVEQMGSMSAQRSVVKMILLIFTCLYSSKSEQHSRMHINMSSYSFRVNVGALFRNVVHCNVYIHKRKMAFLWPALHETHLWHTLCFQQFWHLPDNVNIMNICVKNRLPPSSTRRVVMTTYIHTIVA